MGIVAQFSLFPVVNFHHLFGNHIKAESLSLK